jgi:hypothetical protein
LDEAERCHRVALLNQGKLLFCDTPANLKAALGKDVLSITSADPRSLRSQLEHAEGISSLVLTGDGLHIVVDDAVRRIPEFAARLKRLNVPFDSPFTQVAPTIEDLFVDAVKAERRPCLNKMNQSWWRTWSSASAILLPSTESISTGPKRRSLWISRTQRGRQIHHHSHALRTAEANLGQCTGCRLRCCAPTGSRAAEHRLHVAEVLTL